MGNEKLRQRAKARAFRRAGLIVLVCFILDVPLILAPPIIFLVIRAAIEATYEKIPIRVSDVVDMLDETDRKTMRQIREELLVSFGLTPYDDLRLPSIEWELTYLATHDYLLAYDKHGVRIRVEAIEHSEFRWTGGETFRLLKQPKLFGGFGWT